MRKFFTVFLLVVLFSAMSFAQYNWVLKQSGSSLGGPVDYLMTNHNVIYYGSNSTIYKSTNAGESFFQTGTFVPSASEIKCIILDDNTPGTFLVAVESSPNDKIYKTTNDGANWTLTLDEGQMSYFGIPMTQDPSIPQNIFTMTNANFKKSTDFGSTWATISSNFGPTTAPCDIEVFPGTSTIIIGDNGTGIFRSTDYGITWTQTFSTSGEIPTLAVDFTHPGIAWATKWSGGGGFLKSTDYGATWVAQPSFSGINMWGVSTQVSDGNLVMAGCYSCGNTWRTKNGGQTWTQINIGSTNYQVVVIDSMNQFSAQGAGIYKLESPWFIPVELTSFTADVSGSDAILYWSTATELNNQGFEIERSFDNENFERIGFVPGFGTTTEAKDYSYTVMNIPAGVQYYRLKQVDFDGTTTIYNSVQVTGPVPTEFALAQNHPNPFNPSTKITFTLPVKSNVRITLFNLLGQKVSEIVNSDFEAGNQTVDFNAAGLTSGAYIYRISATGENGSQFTSSKKMILMK